MYKNSDITNLKLMIPNSISLCRLLASPILFIMIISGEYLFGLIILILCSFSDILDGYYARRYQACTNLGCWLDPVSDFSIVFFSVLALIIVNLYPFWILIIVIMMFLQFILTSGLKIPLYDPVGKYFGSFSMIIIGITLFLHNQMIETFVAVMMIVFTTISIVSRIYTLINKNNQ